MKKILGLAILIGNLAFSSVSFSKIEPSSCKEIKFDKQANTFANHYFLQDVMEVGSELLLEKDGKFKWYLVVGALDQYAEGIWWKNENCIGLKPEKNTVKI